MQLRLSAFWFFFLGGWGVFFPYYSLYLSRELSLPASQVGVVMAVIPLLGLLAQPLWGQLADRTGSRRIVLAIVAAGAATAALGLVLPRGFWPAAAATGIFAAFSTSVPSMSNAVTLAGVGRQDIGRYGRIRMWGTVGFLVMVIVFPRFLTAVGEASVPGGGGGLAWMFPATAALLYPAALLALGLPETSALGLRSERGDLRRLLRHRPVFRLLVFVFLVHLFIQGPINLFPLYVSDRGGDASTVGRMWILMLLLEIPLIGFSGVTLRRLGARGLLRMGLATESLRWIVCAFAEDLAVAGAVQVLHGVGVAGILIGGPLYLEQSAPERLRSTGQALVASVTFGAGAILSNTAFGFLVERFGVSVPYAISGVGALLLAIGVRAYLPLPALPDSKAG